MIINDLTNFVQSPIGIILILFGLYLLIQTREHLDITPNTTNSNNNNNSVRTASDIIQISETPTRRDRDVQLSIDPKNREKLPPTVYEETRSVLPTGPSKEGQQVWKQVVKRSSSFLPEEIAKQQSKQSLNLKPKAKKVNTTTVFTEKAVKLANKDPKLAATLINQQGLSGYLESSGKTRQQAADNLGMTLSEVNQTLVQELKVDPAELEVKYRADGELSGDVTLELKRKLDDMTKRLQANSQNQSPSMIQKIQQADPDFEGIQSNWIVDK